MLELYIDDIDIFNPIKDKMAQIIEYFVKFYGEANRKIITEKLLNARFHFLEKCIEQKSIINSLKEFYEKKIKENRYKFWEEISEELNIEVDENNIFFCSRHNPKILQELQINIENDKPITALFDDILIFLGYEIEDEKHNKNNSKLALESNKEKVLNNLKIMIKLWDNKYESLEQDIINNREKSIKNLQKFEGNKINFHKLRLQMVEKLFLKHLDKSGFKFNSNAFESKEEYLETIDDYLCNSKIRNPIEIRQFIKLFRSMGFEYGQIYEDYLKDDKLMAFFWNNKIQRDYRKIDENLLKIRIENNLYFDNVIKDIQKEGNVYGINEFASSLFSYLNSGHIGGYVTTTFVNDNIITHCIVPQYFSLCTKVLVHEMCHIIDINFNNEKKGKYSKCGFDILENSTNENSCVYNVDKVVENNYNYKNKVKKYGKYELFNEVINDYFANKIAEKMKKDNFEVGEGIDSLSRYSQAFPLIKEFIEENIDILKEYKLNTSINSFGNFIGKENFSDLATAINNFFTLDFHDLKFTMEEINKKIQNIINVGDPDYKKIKDIKWNNEEMKVINLHLIIEKIRKHIKNLKGKWRGEHLQDEIENN